MMPTEHIKKMLIQIYKESIKKTVNAIGDIPELESLLTSSSQHITSKWESGQKTLRTATVYELLPDYPEEVLWISLFLDAIINMLDDLYDEPPDKDESAKIVFELLRTESLLLEALSGEQNLLISGYLLKIIDLAFKENIYLNLMNSTNIEEEYLNFAYECYRCRSMDMDIFYEIPLQSLNMGDSTQVLKAGRILRSVDILLKDALDLDYDIERNNKSPLTILQRKNPSHNHQCINKLITKLKADSKKIHVSPKNSHREVLENIKQAIKQRAYHIS